MIGTASGNTTDIDSNGVGYVHTHGSYDEGFNNNQLSASDKAFADIFGIPMYAAFPNGTMDLRDNNQTTNGIVTNLDADPNDPSQSDEYN